MMIPSSLVVWLSGSLIKTFFVCVVATNASWKRIAKKNPSNPPRRFMIQINMHQPFFGKLKKCTDYRVVYTSPDKLYQIEGSKKVLLKVVRNVKTTL